MTKLKKNTIFPIILSIVISILLALFVYFVLIHYVVEVDLEHNHRELTVLNFYEQSHDRDIFIIGSSQVNEDIDAYLIDDSFNGRNINRSVYILGLDAETPFSRVPELNNLVASKPKMVIIGLSYFSLGNNTEIYEDRFALISQRISCDKECESLFNTSYVKSIYQTPFEHLLYERKFLIPYLISQSENLGLLHKDKKNIYNNFKDPWIHETNKTESEKIVLLKNISSTLSTPVLEDLNPQKKAFLYTIKKFQKNNISVFCINMPLNPYYSDTINELTRKNFSDFLNSTGINWHDYEREYTSGYFTDLTHLNIAGRYDFSKKVTTIIIDQLKNGE